MHTGIDGKHRTVVQIRPVLRRLRVGRCEDHGGQCRKGGGYCAAMSANLGHFAASNWDFFVPSSSFSFSTWRVQSAPTPSEIALNNGSTAPLATSSHTPFVFGVIVLTAASQISLRPFPDVSRLVRTVGRRLGSPPSTRTVVSPAMTPSISPSAMP